MGIILLITHFVKPADYHYKNSFSSIFMQDSGFNTFVDFTFFLQMFYFSVTTNISGNDLIRDKFRI